MIAEQQTADREVTEPSKGADELARKRRLFRAYEDNKRREIDEQKESRRYYSGRQWTDAEIAKLNKRNQPVIWDNRIARKVDFLVGVEQRMRRDPKAYGRGPQDAKSADIATASLRYVMDINRWEQIASDGAHDGMVSGIGVAWVGASNGTRGTDPKIKRGQVDRFFYDPRSTLPDFTDARYMGMHLWLDIEDVAAEHPDKAEDLRGLVDKDGGLGATAIDEDREEQWGDFEAQRVRVVEMYERKPLAAAVNGYAWYYCKFTGHLELDSMWSPYHDENGVPDCPYVAWSPYVDERGDRYGVVRNMRPMQDEVNHRRSKLLHRTNVKQVQLQEGMVEDEDVLRHELARPDGLVKHQGVWGQTIGMIDQSTEMRGEAELLAQAQSSLENLGPNPGMIGKGGGIADQSGRAILAQRDSGMTELSPVFDRLRDWKLRIYRKAWARTRQLWQGERYIRISEDPAAPQYLGINVVQTDPMSGMALRQNTIAEIDVDIILEEGPDTIVMQEELLQTLSQLGDAAVGPLGKVVIELSQVNNKEKLLKLMEAATAPDPAVQALNARMAQLEAALKEATVAKTHAETEAKRVDSAVKLAGVMMPPQAVPQMFPMPFADQGGQMPQPMPPPGIQGPMNPQAMQPPPQQMPPMPETAPEQPGMPMPLGPMMPSNGASEMGAGPAF